MYHTTYIARKQSIPTTRNGFPPPTSQQLLHQILCFIAPFHETDNLLIQMLEARISSPSGRAWAQFYEMDAIFVQVSENFTARRYVEPLHEVDIIFTKYTIAPFWIRHNNMQLPTVNSSIHEDIRCQ